MVPESNRTRNYIIAAIALAICIMLFLLLHAISSKKTTTSNKPGAITTHTDTNSGESVANIQGEGSQQLGLPADYPSFLGINNLVNYGLTTDQVTNMKNAFYQYTKANNLAVKQVSISVDTIKKSALNAGTENRISVLAFNAIFDDKTVVKASLQYYSLSNTQLFLYDSNTGNQIYDSGLLTASY